MVRIEIRGQSPWNDNTFSVVVEETSFAAAKAALSDSLKLAKSAIANSLGEGPDGI